VSISQMFDGRLSITLAILVLATTVALALSLAVLEYMHRRQMRAREAGRQAWLDSTSLDADHHRLETWRVNPAGDDAGGA
jgi:hypothetical protein